MRKFEIVKNKGILNDAEIKLLETWEYVPFKFWGEYHFNMLCYFETLLDIDGHINSSRMRNNGTTHLKNGIHLKYHNDYNCGYDLEKHGLITFRYDKVEMTSLGNELVAEIRDFKSKGGNFSDFEISDKLKQEIELFILTNKFH